MQEKEKNAKNEALGQIDSNPTQKSLAHFLL